MNDFIPSWVGIEPLISELDVPILAIFSKACHWLFNYVHCNVKHGKDWKPTWSKDTPIILWWICIPNSNRNFSWKAKLVQGLDTYTGKLSQSKMFQTLY